MEKKYQVFVSSTYEDLQEERKKVMEALLQMNCFPVGMEYFNASDSSQWEVIKSLIRECDYYVLIVAGRYGSIEEESGKSYTQKEFEYAIEQAIPVISFVHKNPEILPGVKIELNSDNKKKLGHFKSDIQRRLCKYWDNADGLAAQVVLSLTSLIKTNPRVGWVKADEISSADANKEILALKKENEDLKNRIEKLTNSIPVGTEHFRQGDDLFHIKLKNVNQMSIMSGAKKSLDLYISWNEIFAILAPHMLNESSEEALQRVLEEYVLNVKKTVDDGFAEYKLDDIDFRTIIIQLFALKLILTSERKRSAHDHSSYWKLTEHGNSLMMQLRALTKDT